MIENELRKKWLSREFWLPIFNQIGVLEYRSCLVLEKIEMNDCVLSIFSNGMDERIFNGYNCHQALDEYRQLLDADQLVIGCFGALKNFYVTKGMAKKSFGLAGFLTEFGSIPITEMNLPIRETFAECWETNELCSVTDQRAFRMASIAAENRDNKYF